MMKSYAMPLATRLRSILRLTLVSSNIPKKTKLNCRTSNPTVTGSNPIGVTSLNGGFLRFTN